MEITKIRVARVSDKAKIVDFQMKMALETEGETLDEALVTKGVKAAIADPSLGTYFVAEVDGVNGVTGEMAGFGGSSHCMFCRSIEKRVFSPLFMSTLIQSYSQRLM